MNGPGSGARASWALLAALAPAQEGGLELLSILPQGDPVALAVDAEERRAWVVEGCALVELDLGEDAPGTELRRGVIDAAVVSMTVLGDTLWIAGGSQGLWRVALDGEALVPRPLRDEGDAVCTAVAAVGNRIAVTFAARESSSLCVLDPGAGDLVRRVPLRGVRPLDLASHGRVVFLALGLDGLGRVDLAREEPVLERGPRLDHLPVPEGFTLGPGFVRDVAIWRERLVATADGAGLVSVPLTEPWSPGGACTPVELGAGAGLFAHRVAVHGSRLAVGLLGGPCELADGAPYGSFGRFGAELEVGGIAEGTWVRASGDGIVVLDEVGGDLRPTARIPLPRAGFRALILGERRVYAQLVGPALRVWELTQEGPSPVLERRPPGLPAMDGAVSQLDPRLAIFGRDTSGSVPRGLPARRGDELVLHPGSRSITVEGLLVGEPWRDGPLSEWLVVGWARGWQLTRLTHGASLRMERWLVPVPPAPDGERGHTYLSSLVDGDLCLFARARTTHGLVGYSRSALVEEALRVPAESTLECAPLFQILTHDADSDWPPTTWRPALLVHPDGRRLVVLAAGSRAPRAGERVPSGAGVSRVLILDASEGTAAPPRRLAVVEGVAGSGQAMSVATGVLDGRPTAFVGELSGGLTAIDLTDPGAPRIRGRTRVPPSAFDGWSDPVLDLELRPDGELVAACGRTGLVRLAAGNGAPKLLEVADTPGWAVGLARDGEYLWVGDQKAGVRLYRWPTSPASSR